MRWIKRVKKSPEKYIEVYVKMRDGKVGFATYIGLDEWIFSEETMKHLGIDSIAANMIETYKIVEWAKQENEEA